MAASPIAGIQAGTTPTSNMPPPSTSQLPLICPRPALRNCPIREAVYQALRSRSSSSSHLAPPNHPQPTRSAGTTTHSMIRPNVLHVGVKRTGRQLAATRVAGQPHLGRLFYIHDISSNTRFLVDTGAEVSVVSPFHTERSHQPSTFTLQAANGSKITTFGV